jgi:hypothetical protein
VTKKGNHSSESGTNKQKRDENKRRRMKETFADDLAMFNKKMAFSDVGAGVLEDMPVCMTEKSKTEIGFGVRPIGMTHICEQDILDVSTDAPISSRDHVDWASSDPDKSVFEMTKAPQSSEGILFNSKFGS